MLLRSWAEFTRWLYRCWRDPVKKAALMAALACAACLAILAGPPYFSTASVPQRWPWSAEIEVQTVRDLEDLRLTLGDAPSQDRETMRIKLWVDFAFITSYVALLALLGVLRLRGGGCRRWAAVALMICALAMGAFDVLENLAILDILDVRIPAATGAMLDAIRRPSQVKWSLAAVCAVLLMSFYEPSSRSEIPSPVQPDQG